MSSSTLSYLAGMLALFVGQRILDGIDEWQTAATVLGALLLLAGAVLRFRSLRGAEDPGLRLGHRVALLLLLTGAVAVVLYVGTTERFMSSLSLDDQGEERWLGSMRSLWPVVWLLGTIPLLVVDYGLRSSPVVIPKARVRETLAHGLVAAMGLCLVFPLNYVSSKRNERWDLAYFKTPVPGTATHALVEALEEPVTVRIFMPPSSEVAQELRHYFAPLEGPKLSVEILDQAANPTLAKALAVRDNGTVAITQGDISVLLDAAVPKPEGEGDGAAESDDRPKPVTRRYRVNADFEKAKRSLKKIDAEVGKMLNNQGLAYRAIGRDDDALESFEQAHALRRRVLGPDHPDVAKPLANIATILRARGEYEDAAEYVAKALAIRQRAHGEDSVEAAFMHASLGLIRLEQGRPEPARQRLTTAILAIEQALGAEDVALLGPLLSLAESERQLGRLDDATSHVERAWALVDALKLGKAEQAQVHQRWAAVRWDRGDTVGAWTEAELAQQAYEDLPDLERDAHSDAIARLHAWQQSHPEP